MWPGAGLRSSLTCRTATDSQEDGEVPQATMAPGAQWKELSCSKMQPRVSGLMEISPEPRVWVQTQLTGVAADTCTVVCDPGPHGAERR